MSSVSDRGERAVGLCLGLVLAAAAALLALTPVAQRSATRRLILSRLAEASARLPQIPAAVPGQRVGARTTACVGPTQGFSATLTQSVSSVLSSWQTVGAAARALRPAAAPASNGSAAVSPAGCSTCNVKPRTPGSMPIRNGPNTTPSATSR